MIKMVKTNDPVVRNYLSFCGFRQSLIRKNMMVHPIGRTNIIKQIKEMPFRGRVHFYNEDYRKVWELKK